MFNRSQGNADGVILYGNTTNTLLMSWSIKMEKIAEGISDFGDFKAVLFRTSNGRHFVRFEPLNSSEKPHVEWLSGNDHLEWLRCLAYNQHCKL